MEPRICPSCKKELNQWQSHDLANCRNMVGRMKVTEHRFFDLVITTDYTEGIRKIEKAGVVIWPTEQHTAPTQDWQHDYGTFGGEPDPMDANSYMVGGDHYKTGDAVGMCPHCRRPVEHWDWSFNLKGLEYAITKYTGRWRQHPKPLEALKKIIHYAQKLIEIHFPDTVVSITYRSNENQKKSCSGNFDEDKPATGETQKFTFRETEKSPTVDGQQPEDQTARVDSSQGRCTHYVRILGEKAAVQCMRRLGHPGSHEI